LQNQQILNLILPDYFSKGNQQPNLNYVVRDNGQYYKIPSDQEVALGPDKGQLLIISE